MINAKYKQWFAIVIFSAMLFLPAAHLSANPTQDEVFRSIQDNVDQSVDGKKMLAGLAAAVSVVILIAVFSKRQTRKAVPQVLNHKGKLLREVMKTAGLTSGQLKKLEALSAQMEKEGRGVESPLTLLLCPSLLQPAPGKEAQKS